MKSVKRLKNQIKMGSNHASHSDTVIDVKSTFFFLKKSVKVKTMFAFAVAAMEAL